MPTDNQTSYPPYLKGGGEMGELIRSTDWAKTPLGPAESWPTPLKLAVSTMLSSPFAMYIAWGKEYTQLYNDGYRPILGSTKHPQAIGISTRETFAEIWHIIGSMFDGVMEGRAVGFPNFMLPLDRNGYVEECYFDFSYSPISDEYGAIGGVLVTVVEITEKVKLISELKRAKEDLEKAQQAAESQSERLRRFFMQSPAGICVLDGPEFVFELVNPLYQQLFPERELLGKRVLDALPEIKGQPIEAILKEVYETGKAFEGKELLVPLARTDNGHIEDRYFNFIYQARLDENGKVDGILAFVIEITEMVLTKRRVQESEKRFSFLLNAMPQQVWTATPEGELDYVNQVIRNDFGKSKEEIIGKGWQGYIHPDDLPACLKKWQRSLETAKEYLVEFRLLMNDGSYTWHLGRALPLIENGQVKLWLGTNTNIDIQKSNEQKKDEFLSIASHELKTPLTSIKAFNQLMHRAKDTEKLNSYIHKSAEHISRLEKLINDLLDVTKINAGKMHYSMEPFNFKQMLVDSIESVQHLSASHQIMLTNAEDIEYTGDRFRLEQVLNNFLTNAIKYSPRGEKIIVNCKTELDNIIVSVQDFGIGIAEDHLDRLFDRYYRVDNTAMRFDGLGLGLFISSEILKRHNGSFWIESEVGKGSVFYFRLPLTSRKETIPVVKTQEFYQDSHITISYNKAFDRVDVDWTGFQDMESVQGGCMLMLDYMAKNNCDRIVNDNRHVLGTWSEAADWVGNEWFPMMEKAGLKYFALIFSPSTFSQLSAKKSIDIMAGIITTQYFTDIQLAEEWIDTRPRK